MKREALSIDQIESTFGSEQSLSFDLRGPHHFGRVKQKYDSPFNILFHSVYAL